MYTDSWLENFVVSLVYTYNNILFCSTIYPLLTHIHTHTHGTHMFTNCFEKFYKSYSKVMLSYKYYMYIYRTNAVLLLLLYLTKSLKYLWGHFIQNKENLCLCVSVENSWEHNIKKNQLLYSVMDLCNWNYFTHFLINNKVPYMQIAVYYMLETKELCGYLPIFYVDLIL